MSFTQFSTSLKWIMGNWKMNGSVKAVEHWRSTLEHKNSFQKPATCEPTECWQNSVIFPPAPYLAMMKNFPFAIGSQGCSSHSLAGAHTQHISATMVRDVGGEFVLLGHSETRRNKPGEGDAIGDIDEIKQQILAAWQANLSVVMCSGDSFQEHQHDEAVAHVIDDILACVPPTVRPWHPSRPALFIAYEPLWAIGASAVDPREVAPRHARLKSFLKDHYGPVPLLYGGAVDKNVVAGFLKDPCLDGVLVGRASLDPLSFSVLLAARKVL